MAVLSVGKEVLSHCSKCKLILSHIIVTMKGTKGPDKVECKTCKGTHAFKDPGKSKSKVSIDKVIKSAKDKSSSSHKKASESVGDLWAKAIQKYVATAPKSYSTKGSFIIGDIIEHPSFGQGVVEKLVDNNKIEVIFQDDYRTLMHKK